ncbi:flagellar biosynthesis anti-sigma factor FlgM [Effusibacillus lacus]|uniref:Negative regulator of flagellin synthesis n=1 Tax=Effusibacillus lacus TaxID=1348429 RepID=A0A292YJE8_9BACL|nr:flagellar biosynthesis anti-sigma factor FlgM [Effusibacillus lacus]TCS69811.1 FlgM family anti-sigma-28 factor [Effusibacillus lacus]GAX88893.1 flagellar biosynthesis anti-sigma factor FlgM [Effusibacillus lacus]
MKIYENGRIQSLQAYQKNQPAAKPGLVKAKSSGKDELSISQEALEMAQVGMTPANGDKRLSRTDRLEQLKQLVENGTYEVNEHKIADKIARYLLGE